MLLNRVLSAVVGIPVALYLIWYGGIPMLAAVLFITGLGIWEINRLWNKMGIRIWLAGAIASGMLFVLAAYFVNGIQIGTLQLEGPLLINLVILLMITGNIFYLIRAYPAFTFTGIGATVFSSVYLGWFLAHLLSLRLLGEGFHFVVLVFAATWSTDTFAYFVGVNFGRHKLAPVLSPKKSVEGSVGGVIGSILICVVIGYINPRMPLINYAVVGLLAGTMGQIGDLAESALKRMAGVKDSGSIIPGHGGVLDRFDSLLLTAPIVYYYLKFSLI